MVAIYALVAIGELEALPLGGRLRSFFVFSRWFTGASIIEASTTNKVSIQYIVTRVVDVVESERLYALIV